MMRNRAIENWDKNTLFPEKETKVRQTKNRYTTLSLFKNVLEKNVESRRFKRHNFLPLFLESLFNDFLRTFLPPP